MNSNNYANGYEIVDDIDDIDSARNVTASTTTAATKRRTGSRQMSVNANLLSNANGANYKTSEASHFGTIGRSTVVTRKAKINSVTALNAQNNFFDNDL